MERLIHNYPVQMELQYFVLHERRIVMPRRDQKGPPTKAGGPKNGNGGGKGQAGGKGSGAKTGGRKGGC